MIEQESSQLCEQITNTNQVLKVHVNDQLTYFLPAYLRLNFKNFRGLNLSDLSGQINCTLLFSVCYDGFPEEHLGQLIHRNVLLFNLSGSIELKEGVNKKEGIHITFNHKKQQKLFTYTIRKFLLCSARPQVFWSPCEVIDMIISVSVKSISFISEDKQRVNVKFNLMDHKNKFLKISYSEQGAFGMYDLAESRLQAEYTNYYKASTVEQLVAKRVRKSQLVHPQSDGQSMIKMQEDEKPLKSKKNKIENFSYAHFTISVYKKPLPTLLTIFIPLFLLGIINMGIFFQPAEESGKRSLNIATLMVSYVALIPTIREQIPPSPHIVFIQFLFYMETLTTFFSWVQFIMVRGDAEVTLRYNANWQHQGFLIASIIVTAFNFVAVVLLYLAYKFLWKPSYNLDIQNEKIQKFLFSTWKNPQCDKHFHDALNN